MMTPDSLRAKLIKEFDSVKLLHSLDLKDSTFQELPRLFETSHLAMQVVLSEVSALATASRIAAALKRDLAQQGIELEYSITVRWQIANPFPNALERSEDGGWIPRETFHVELRSGETTHSVSIRLSPNALKRIWRYRSALSVDVQAEVLSELLRTCLEQQLQRTGLGRWDPLLSLDRALQEDDIVLAIQSSEVAHQPAQPEIAKTVTV